MDQTQPNLDHPTFLRSGRGRNLAVVGERMAPEGTPTLQRPDASLAAREAALARKEASVTAILATFDAAFAILGSRALVILAALGSFAMFGWAAYEPTGWRFAAACAFTLMVFAPALFIDRRGG